MWNEAPTPDPTDDAPPGALAMLGVVGLLALILRLFLLPLAGRCLVVDGTLVRMQGALVVLAAAAWAELEAAEHGRPVSLASARTEAACERVLLALRAVMAALAKLRRRPSPFLRREIVVPAWPGNVALVPASRGARARDGPSACALHS